MERRSARSVADDKTSAAYVDTVLDATEDRYKNGGRPDDRLERRDFPEAIHLSRASNEIPDGMDDDSRKTSVGNPVEGSRQSVQRDDDDDANDETSGGCSNACFALDGGTTEGSGSGVGGEEGADGVGYSDGNELLRRVDLVVVDATEGASDCYVLEEKDDGRNGD